MMRRINSRIRNLVITAGTLGAGTLHAQSTGVLKGRVTAPHGLALQGATIAVSNTVRIATTRGDGSYDLTLPAGRYEVRTRLLGYAQHVDSVTVVAKDAV